MPALVIKCLWLLCISPLIIYLRSVSVTMSVILFVILLLILLLIYGLKCKDPKPIFGVYSLPGKWYYLKYAVFAAFYYYRRYSNKISASGKLANPADMDRAQPLSEHPKAIDAVFFICASANDEGQGIYFISGCERRPMGMCNGVFCIVLPGKGLLCSKKLPDTVLFGAQDSEFGAEGIMMTPVEPMKKWRVTYNGQMWYKNDPKKLVDVVFEGEWTAATQCFVYDTDLYAPAVIRSIAREKWSREYFENLKTAHQYHYDQFGVMKWKVEIDKESFMYTMPCWRDHTFGHKRDWSLMHRFIFEHIFLKNGIRISIAVINQPCTASNFEVGYVALANGTLLPVKWVDLQLWQHGEGGQPPKDYAYRFGAGDQVYTVQVLVEYESTHYYTHEWEARILERFCKYSVNGVAGNGLSEFHYRHRDGRPESVARSDPDWFRRMRHKI